MSTHCSQGVLKEKDGFFKKTIKNNQGKQEKDWFFLKSKEKRPRKTALIILFLPARGGNLSIGCKYWCTKLCTSCYGTSPVHDVILPTAWPYFVQFFVSPIPSGEKKWLPSWELSHLLPPKVGYLGPKVGYLGFQGPFLVVSTHRTGTHSLNWKKPLPTGIFWGILSQVGDRGIATFQGVLQGG